MAFVPLANAVSEVFPKLNPKNTKVILRKGKYYPKLKDSSELDPMMDTKLVLNDIYSHEIGTPEWFYDKNRKEFVGLAFHGFLEIKDENTGKKKLELPEIFILEFV